MSLICVTLFVIFFIFFDSLGHIERRYIEVPHGASWAEVTMKTSGFDTVRRFYVGAVQVRLEAWNFLRLWSVLLTCFLCPAVPTAKTFEMGDFCKFSFSAAKSFSFRVVSSQTLELVISQFWPSGTGSHETASVDFEVLEFLFRWTSPPPRCLEIFFCFFLTNWKIL